MRMPRRSLAVASVLLTLSLGAGAAVGATHHAAAKTKAARSHAATSTSRSGSHSCTHRSSSSSSGS